MTWQQTWTGGLRGRRRGAWIRIVRLQSGGALFCWIDRDGWRVRLRCGAALKVLGRGDVKGTLKSAIPEADRVVTDFLASKEPSSAESCTADDEKDDDGEPAGWKASRGPMVPKKTRPVLDRIAACDAAIEALAKEIAAKGYLSRRRDLEALVSEYGFMAAYWLGQQVERRRVGQALGTGG